MRHTTDLAATVGDYLGGSGGDEDDAAAAAREARESLERMWASSAGSSSQEQDDDDDDDGDDDQLLREVREALPELQGEGADGDSAKASPDIVLSVDHRHYFSYQGQCSVLCVIAHIECGLTLQPNQSLLRGISCFALRLGTENIHEFLCSSMYINTPFCIAISAHFTIRPRIYSKQSTYLVHYLQQNRISVDTALTQQQSAVYKCNQDICTSARWRK